MSNMKQLGLGFMQYTQDYDERMPGVTDGSSSVNVSGGWTFFSSFANPATAGAFDPGKGSLYPYVKSAQIFVCPSDTTGQSSRESYAINSCMAGPTKTDNVRPGKSLAAFDETSKWMMTGEEGTPNDNTTSTDDGYLLYATNDFSSRHLDGVNVGFLDGHAKWFRVEKIKSDRLQTGGLTPAGTGTDPCV